MGSKVKKGHPLHPLIDQLVEFKRGLTILKDKDRITKKVNNILGKSRIKLPEIEIESLKTAISEELMKDEKLMSFIIKFHKEKGLAGDFLEWMLERPGSVRLNRNYESNESDEDRIIDAYVISESSNVRVQLKGMQIFWSEGRDDYRTTITGKRNTKFMDEETGEFNLDEFAIKLNDDYEMLDYEVVVFREFNKEGGDWDYLVVAFDAKKFQVDVSKFVLRKTRRNKFRHEYDYNPEVCKLVLNKKASYQACKEVAELREFIKINDAEVLYCDESLSHIIED